MGEGLHGVGTRKREGRDLIYERKINKRMNEKRKEGSQNC